MAKKKRPPRRPVTVPLSPTILYQIGGLKALPPPDPKFDPKGTWTHTYRIWTCYGYTSGRTDGSLRLTRKPGSLTVRQTMRNADNVVNIIEATIHPRKDRAFDVPECWGGKSTFTDTKGKLVPELTRSDSVRRPPYDVTTDWSLFSTVQQLPFEELAPRRFDVYEGLTLLKRDHRLGYHGAETAKIGSASHRLHVFHQIGRGTLPYEYWVDEGHRLLVVVTGPRAYILDPEGDAK
ncbi:hypothetical protein HQ560_07035 [bacterium]|nr:hypothetical protein [bacterium]